MLDLVIPDSGPLITLGLIDRLDLIDRFNCAILITDMVAYELLRGSDAAPDKAVFEKWFSGRGNRIQTTETTYGMMWQAIPLELQRKIKRQHPDAGEQSIREFTDKLKFTLPEDDNVLVLFEEDSVKRISFGSKIHLIHTYAFMITLERLGVIASSEEIYNAVIAKGRNLARDTFERRATDEDGADADWQVDYRIRDT
jgi:hypothetical protein